MLDISTDAVVRALSDQGVPCTRFNTETYPFSSGLTVRLDADTSFNALALRKPVAPVATEIEPSSIWFRRVRIPPQPLDMAPGIYDFCLREARSTLLGAVLAQPARVMSPPPNVWAAENKVFQLATARAIGLKVPETVVTNEPQAVADAFRYFGGRMIAKPARNGFVDYGNEQRAVYTTQILEEHLADLDAARWSPVIYQRLVAKRCDVRVTYVGGEIFVAEIDSQTDPDAAIDWRRTSNPELPHRRSSLPPETAAGVERLMARLGLEFGAIDFIRTTEDEYVFLEVNPNGQWLWLEDRLQLPITASIAKWLSGTER